MKSVQKKMLAVTLLIVSFLLSPVWATYDNPWLPDWSTETGYTSQFWGLHDVDGAEPAVPLSADIYKQNGGDATASWTNDPGGMVTWAEGTGMGSHPSWVDDVYGGMYQMSGYWDICADIDTGSDAGSLKVFVQYDWYSYGDVSVDVNGATDITPGGYYDVVLGTSGSGNDWLRTTKVFEFTDNPGLIDIDFGASGFAPMIDSFSVTTAVDAAVPAQMPVPEPATIALLGLGFIMSRRKRG